MLKGDPRSKERPFVLHAVLPRAGAEQLAGAAVVVPLLPVQSRLKVRVRIVRLLLKCGVPHLLREWVQAASSLGVHGKECTHCPLHPVDRVLFQRQLRIALFRRQLGGDAKRTHQALVHLHEPVQIRHQLHLLHRHPLLHSRMPRGQRTLRVDAGLEQGDERRAAAHLGDHAAVQRAFVRRVHLRVGVLEAHERAQVQCPQAAARRQRADARGAHVHQGGLLRVRPAYQRRIVEPERLGGREARTQLDASLALLPGEHFVALASPALFPRPLQLGCGRLRVVFSFFRGVAGPRKACEAGDCSPVERLGELLLGGQQRLVFGDAQPLEVVRLPRQIRHPVRLERGLGVRDRVLIRLAFLPHARRGRLVLVGRGQCLFVGICREVRRNKRRERLEGGVERPVWHA